MVNGLWSGFAVDVDRSRCKEEKGGEKEEIQRERDKEKEQENGNRK